MITIQNGKLNIPDIDRFVGFAGDNSVMTKQFYMINHVGINCTYTLCLRFDDDVVRTVPLTAAVDGDDTVLTWEVKRTQLHSAGVVAAQLKITGSDGYTAHSSKDFFLIASSVELDEGGDEAEYVTPSQMQNSINQALQTVTATAPYVDDDGYWCIYDPEAGEYVQTEYRAAQAQPDSAMSDSSDNTVSNKTIKRYVDEKSGTLVPDTRKIAQIALAADIDASDLMDALRPWLYRTRVTPNSSGVTGLLGIGVTGEVYFCTDTDNWVHLALYTDLYEKMDLITEIDAANVDVYEDGSMFFINGVLYVKYDGSLIALSKANDVYTKAEINTMIGNIESLLAAV